MKLLGRPERVTILFLGLALLTGSSRAVLFEATSDPTYNTTAPSGALTNSGWQYEGQWGSYLGTPIAPTFFLAAQHVGGSTGDVFMLNGYNYHTVAYADCPNSDLRVWQVAETFPLYAPLYTASNEVGQLCVVFGRGTQRGSQVVTNGQLKGWLWGPGDQVQRWGENIVSLVHTSSYKGELIEAGFDRIGITNECHLSVGDSSGAMFIQEGATWKLAGIHYGVDGYFSYDGTTNTQFDAALVDIGGLWVGSGTSWTYVSDDPPDYPSSFYSTRIATRVSWINTAINFQPGNDLRISGIQFDGASCQISLSTGSNRLYRVEQCSDLVTGGWTTVTNNVAGNGATVVITDSGAADQPQRFYRAVLLQ